MMASYLGGISIATSQVGMVHALSYGLSYLLGIKHGEGNCLVLNQIEQYYPEGYAEFQQMLEKNNIVLRKNICKDLRNKDFEMMSKVALGLEPLWENTFGKDWREAIKCRKNQRNLSTNISLYSITKFQTRNTTGKNSRPTQNV